jgi:hypothetical protein
MAFVIVAMCWDLFFASRFGVESLGFGDCAFREKGLGAEGEWGVDCQACRLRRSS